MKDIIESTQRPRVSVRQATREDIPFVAQCVLASVDLYDFMEDSIEKDIALKVCSLDDTLYSWRNARIATVEGIAVGCLISYDGGIYPEGRKRTFKYFADAGRPMDNSEAETGPGEYYLDAMAIRPAFRGYGIGHVLMHDALDIAKARGIKKISLIVECSKPELRAYYAQLGFIPERELDAFGKRYLRMVLITR